MEPEHTFPTALRDGRTVLVRRIAPADAGLLRAFDCALTPASRRMRYLAVAPAMTPARASQLATMNFRDQFGFVAVPSGRARIVADCHLLPFASSGHGWEIAIAVADDYQNAGLGRSLLRLMLETACACGVGQIVADVNQENVRMRHLLCQLGFTDMGHDGDVLTLTLLPAVAA
jgi:RimJ/RimL family protein N-acetyltransferase